VASRRVARRDSRLVADEVRASSNLSTSATLLLNLLMRVELRLGQWVHALSKGLACIGRVYTNDAAWVCFACCI
jgi:hypothetical protein